MKTDCNVRTAEFVLPGHPDKLADAIADAIVQEARRREQRALVGVEVALHRNAVFIDGRVGCRGAETIDFKGIAREVYESAGYGRGFAPFPKRLKVITELCLGPLLPGEAEFREVSDDQSIVTGYACSLPGTEGLPIEHALARRLAFALHSVRTERPDLRFGPDGKVIVFVEESIDGRRFRLIDLSLSIQHAADWDAVAARRAIEREVHSAIEAFAIAVPGFDASVDCSVEINAAGDFVEGGPHGDNGLSGKKLVADFYGPRVPIGGGAMSGKDFWKVDRAGPLIARNLAMAAVQRLGCRECLVTLGIRPGDREFRVVRVEAENRQSHDVSRLRGLVDLRLSSMADWPKTAGRLVEVARWGHFAVTPNWERAKPV
jgi:S-adenosylmethionine synthetase